MSQRGWPTGMQRAMALLLLLAVSCGGPPEQDSDPPTNQAEKGYLECAFCEGLVGSASIVEFEHRDRWYRGCIDCRDHFEGLIDTRRDAMTDRTKTYRCDSCGKIWTVPRTEPVRSCCGHRMRRQ